RARPEGGDAGAAMPAPGDIVAISGADGAVLTVTPV
ncbi:MAG: hypothetical protein ACJAVS_002813, partial [Paracoccaceae bacterium]